MLQTETVDPNCFSILNRLMQMPALQNFYLVDGTALSLQFGHRKSIDLDLFTTEPFEKERVISALAQNFTEDFVYEDKPIRFGIFAFIDNVKTDFIHHPHPLINSPVVIENVRMYSTEDIIAMKVQAILGRGKKKDFWDIAELMQHYEVQEFINFHQQKFHTQQLLISIPQALTYFADAEDDEDPVSLKGQTWSSIKHFISNKVGAYLK